MMENKVEKYSNFLFKECLAKKQRESGGDIEKVKEDQERIETRTLLCQATKRVISLAYQARRLKETYA